MEIDANAIYFKPHVLDWNTEYQSEKKETKKSNRKPTCKICDKSFCGKQSLILHQQKIHGLKHFYTCEKCGKRFQFKRQLLSHRSTHVEINKCDECGRIYSNEWNLRAHQRVVHSDKTPFSCNECGEGFLYKNELTLHRNTMHSENPDCFFECWLCHDK